MMMMMIQVDVDDDADLREEEDFAQCGDGRPFPTQNVRIKDVQLEFFLLAIMLAGDGNVAIDGDGSLRVTAIHVRLVQIPLQLFQQRREFLQPAKDEGKSLTDR